MWQDYNRQRLYIVRKNRNVTYNVLSIRQTSLLTTFNVKLDNKPVRCVKRNQLLLKQSKVFKLL